MIERKRKSRSSIDVVPATTSAGTMCSRCFGAMVNMGVGANIGASRRLHTEARNRVQEPEISVVRCGNGHHPAWSLIWTESPPAGSWPRDRMERLVRSRTIPRIDDREVWEIVCFMVRVGYRRKGVAAALLTGAIDFASEAGVPAIEADPIDLEGRRIDVTSGYVGFRPIVETAARSARLQRILMRLELKEEVASYRT